MSKNEQKKVIEYVKKLNIKSIAEKVLNKILEMLEIK